MCHDPHHQESGTDVMMYSIVYYLGDVTVWITTSNDVMSAEVKNLTDAPNFGVGTKEHTFNGLKTALEHADQHNFIFLFFDGNGDITEDEKLKQEIINLRDMTHSKIFFLLASLQNNLGNKISKFEDIGKVIDIEQHSKETTIENIMNALGELEICMDSIPS